MRDARGKDPLMTHVVSLDEVTGKDAAGSNTTVVRSLGAGVTTLGPGKRPAVGVKEGVLLLETEPGLMLLGKLHVLVGLIPVVGLMITKTAESDERAVLQTGAMCRTLRHTLLGEPSEL